MTTAVEPPLVRQGAPTPAVDVARWSLRVYGSGLRGRPGPEQAVSFGYSELLALPTRTIRSGGERWTGPLLYDVLELAGIGFDAVSLLAGGPDDPARRPLPVERALDDVLVVYDLNGSPLPPERGGPASLFVPGSGADSVKRLSWIEVSV